jgi:peptide/nickel transport system substrate-binding protein
MAKSEAMRKPVGSGPFKFVRWVPNATIEIAANTAHYRKRASLDRVIWTIAPNDYNTAMARILSGDADFVETLSPAVMAQVAKTPTLKITTYPGLDFAMMLFNERDPKVHSAPNKVLGDRMVRRALTMGVDRAAIVKNVFDTLAAPAVGPTVRAFPSTDTTLTQIPYDPAAAMRLLDSLGWKVNPSTGVRAKGGVPLAFTVITPSSSKNRERCAVLLQEQLRKIGAHVTIQSLEIAAFLKQQSDRNFDAAMTALHMDANPGSVKQAWDVAEAKNPQGSNAGSYMNPVFDAQVDSAMAMASPEAAKAAFTKAYTTIINDAPAIWLYDLKGVVASHKRVHLAPLRPDAWWAHLSEWSIPANERIARDAPVPQTTPAQ